MRQPSAIVVDDDIGLATAFSIAMRHAGFIARPITDSTIALAEIEKERPDIVILDMNMPVVNGLDILQGIRNNPELVNMKVIMATASGTITQSELVEELADLVLLKPVSLSQITTFATRFAEQSRQTGPLKDTTDQPVVEAE